MFQNFEDYCQKLKSDGKLKSAFLRDVRKECMKRGADISISSLERYSRLEFSSCNDVVKGVLSEMTGIPVENLFKLHLEE